MVGRCFTWKADCPFRLRHREGDEQAAAQTISNHLIDARIGVSRRKGGSPDQCLAGQ